MKDMDIAEVSRRNGVPASTLRYYEEKGLIASTGRRGLRRLFDPAVLERLALIGLGRAGGFALDEISAMLTPDGLPKMDRARLDAKANELDHTIQRLTAIREALRHAARCPAARPMECPTFRRAVRLAGAGRFEVAPLGPFKAEPVPATKRKRKTGGVAGSRPH
ncbi:MerR family transcriptional regulator [Mesorhizobium sp. B2-7-3]|uniref:helix-turn-helix domain-containing protein n=1 Tax=Mesorhizobium sp. B2-7-3 TaxID=2589907 RepID=UPI00112C5E7E|nr:helix-turn-helix domain-containing protein [Mesorhizobium sp. B2-7-3]TPJ16681.1 MerR family transcriptional regulator [Mesorhizobium sp. B2-7-3]